MKIRGRRVVLLIAGALPLLAEENQVETLTSRSSPLVEDHLDDTLTTTTTSDGTPHESAPPRIAQHMLNDDFQIEESEQLTASEAIHNENFRLPPLPGNEKAVNAHLTAPDEDNVGDESIIAGNYEMSDEGAIKGDIPVEEVITIVDSHQDTRNARDEQLDHGEKDATNAVAQEKTQNNIEFKEDASDDHAAVGGEAEKVVNDTPEISTQQLVTGRAAEEGEGSSKTNDRNEEEDDEDSLSRVSVDYASKSAGALIIEKSKDFKGTSNLLNSDRDRYAIAPCEEKKFVVVSLSEDILVKQIKLANYERFSSSVKDFQVLGSQTLGKWFDLGTFSAKAGNGEQTFDLPEPGWVRYLKFKFLSHHGVEYYCTYSQIQVHGSTMVQGFHEQWEDAEGDEDGDLPTNDIDVGLLSNDGVVNDGVVNATASEGDTLESQAHAPNTRADSSESSIGPPVCNLPLSKDLDNKLCGVQALSDEELFSSLYDLIPSTLSCLPKGSRNSLGRRPIGGEVRTINQPGSSGMQSIYTSSKKTIISSKPAATTPSDHIAAPRMTDRLAGSLVYYLGTELGQLTTRWSQPNAAAEVTTEYISTKSVRQMGTNESQSKVLEQRNTVESSQESQKDDTNATKLGVHKGGEETTEIPATEERATETQQDANLESSHDSSLEQGLVKMLENLPSAECLSKLDFAQFKLKTIAGRKPNSASGTSTSSSSTPMEPIFKRLTDEIKSLQASLSVHDQFTKVSVACYQRIMTDIILEMERLRTDHEDRLLKLEQELLSSRGTYLWKIVRSYFGFLHMLLSWVYSTLVYIVTPLFVWFGSLSKGIMRIPGLPYSRILSAWASLKSHLLENEDGSLSDVARYLRPLTAQVDLLVEHMEQAETTFTTEEAALVSKENDEMWRFPVVPIVLMVLLGRVWMCFHSQSAKRLKLPSNSELSEWKAQAVISVTKKPSHVLDRQGKPRAYSVGAQPNHDLPRLVLEATVDSPGSHRAQQPVASNDANEDQLPEKPVVSPISSPSTNA